MPPCDFWPPLLRHPGERPVCHKRPVEGFDQLQFAEAPFSAENSIGDSLA